MKINFLKSALIEVDVQNDFCPKGALAVTDGDKVVAPLNHLARLFGDVGAQVIATQDWHPQGHCSFASSFNKQTGDLPQTILWPDHCVQNSRGADLHPDLDTKPVTAIIRKGFRANMDSYSAFFENDKKTSTGLAGYLKSLDIDTIYVGGLATDYCVFFTLMDAVSLGFKAYLLEDAVRGVGIPQGSVEQALSKMKAAGVMITSTAA
jgi:nicotinamidase/pyrazinamidase